MPDDRNYSDWYYSYPNDEDGDYLLNPDDYIWLVLFLVVLVATIVGVPYALYRIVKAVR